MKVSTKGRYAIRVMLDLALNNTGEYIPLKDVAERQGITLKYLEQIIILLKRAGYLKSTRGNGGGYKLAKKPSAYTIGDIIRTTEGSLAPISAWRMKRMTVNEAVFVLHLSSGKACMML